MMQLTLLFLKFQLRQLTYTYVEWDLNCNLLANKQWAGDHKESMISQLLNIIIPTQFLNSDTSNAKSSQ